jgi:V/A-type H+-transporting ATPase subunit B
VAENPAAPSLLVAEYRTLTYVTGPLIFVDNVHDVAYDEMVLVILPDGTKRSGKCSTYPAQQR